MQSALNLNEIFEPIRKSLPSLDAMLGKGAMMPFNNTNSGGRKLLYGTQREHVIPMNDAEVAFIQTGAENEFGNYSSSLKYCEGNSKLIAKVPKFSKHPNHHYIAIMVNHDTNTVEMQERKCYNHNSESYGYMINNENIDSLKPGDSIKEGALLSKSVCFDEYNNRKDGINLLAAYISCAKTMEDGILISKTAQNRMVTPLIHHVPIIINDNDIPMNIIGTPDSYKIIPDIGEEVPEGILMSLRRENKEEILFSQAYSRLQDILMSDDKIMSEGTVVDITVQCNNPANLNNPYYSQLKYYYDEDMRFCKNIVEVVESLKEVYALSYDLDVLYYDCKKKLNSGQFIKDRPFSNIILDVVLVEQNMIQKGDKLSDRYGGKGVVVGILDDELMPRLANGAIVDIIHNKSTCINRLNAGQIFETEINHIAQHVLEYIQMGVLSVEESLELYLSFLEGCSDQEYRYMRNFINSLDDNDKELFLDDIKTHNGIYQSLRPITDSFTLDKLDALYKRFPFVSQYEVEVPMRNSRGELVYKKAKRPIVCGTKYIYRLKQYAEEKFSVTSLSATNIRNENSRSKANKMYKGLYTKTPIRFGEMETGNMGHMGMDYVITNLLLYSASPHARRMSGEQILTGDPFNIDVKLDTDSTNTGVQILNTLLKTIGLRIVFRKEKINLKMPIIKQPIIRLNQLPVSNLIKPLFRYDPSAYIDPTMIDRLYEAEHTDEGLIRPILKLPIIKNHGTFDEQVFDMVPTKGVKLNE